MSVFDSAENVKKYESWFEKNSPAFKSEVAAIRELLPSGIGFEVGIGTGLFAEKLGIRMGNDPSSEMLKIAEHRGRLVYHCKGDNLPFHDGYFDYTLMVTTICFLDNPLSVLNECSRVTKSKGAIVVAFVDSESLIGKFYRNRSSRSLFYKDATFYSVNEIKQMLVEAGYVIDAVRQTLFGTLGSISSLQVPSEGSGEGAFVVVRGIRNT